MTYIHEQPEWPNFSWDINLIAPALIQARHHQGRILGRMDSLGFSFQEKANLQILTQDVLNTSAIEGEFLNPEAVRSSIARRLGIEFAGMVTPGRDVEGMVEIMVDATQCYKEPLTPERLFSWHSALFPTGRSGMRKITVGNWRTPDAGPMQVVSGPYGREQVHFEAPSADRVDSEMDQFLNWFNAPGEFDLVVKAGMAHFWFITIHPFEDGNGRIARAIADMVLARADGSPHRFYSMSSQIETERREYYLALERQQRSTTDITRWLLWFLGCLDRAFTKTESFLTTVIFKAHFWEWVNRRPVNQRQQKILNRLLDGFQGQLTSSKYAKITHCSTDTALRDIHSLLERGILVQNSSGGRSTSYRLAQESEIPKDAFR
jgi:Fic family protein